MKTYCFKLYKAKRNQKLHRQINAAGLIYNHCIVLHKRYYRLFGKFLNLYRLQKHLPKLKKLAKYGYLKEIGSQAVQDITQRIDRAYKLFFHNLKHKIHAAPPSFRKVSKYKSYTLKQAGWKLSEENTIEIAKEKYRYCKSRDIDGQIKTITVKRDALGDIYLYLACETTENKVLVRTGKSVGFDFGLKKFLNSSDEKDIISPLFFREKRKVQIIGQGQDWN
ncbi:RNA-guided endonuclease InsQ/TnpB family protein [Pectinatus haikarae]|uniref:Transposase n=1 Tax=Pectinatus haikarae TaxID=349096 RepID=A0ABT9Y5M4_9FIRM|nr:transposase [Pectinatus haikarae]MDQ0203122.1 transposase [Pectinatus haikarae]